MPECSELTKTYFGSVFFRILAGSVFVFLLQYPAFNQEPCIEDTQPPTCLIESYTIKGNLEAGGTSVFFPDIASDNCSNVNAFEYFLVGENREIESGEFLTCGTHIIQSILMDKSDNLANCEFKLTIKCLNDESTFLRGTSYTNANVPDPEQLLSEHNRQLLDFELGSLSAIWESGKRGPGTISKGSADPGGVSYGIYQLSYKHGYLEDFILHEGQKYKKRLAQFSPNTEEFNKVWKQIAREDPLDFRKAQHDFIERTHYKKYAERVYSQTRLDITQYSRVLKDVLWSTAVQHGPYNNIFKNALKEIDISKQSEKEIIESVYEERGRLRNGKLVNFPRVSEKWQKSLIHRFRSEKQVALSRLIAMKADMIFVSTRSAPEQDETLVAQQGADIVVVNESVKESFGKEVPNLIGSDDSPNPEGILVSTEEPKQIELQSESTAHPLREQNPYPEIKTGENLTRELSHNKTNFESGSNGGDDIPPLKEMQKYYSILFAVSNVVNMDFPELKEIGNVFTDNPKNTNLIRYIVGKTESMDDASLILKQVKEKGFRSAKVVQCLGTNITEIIN